MKVNWPNPGNGNTFSKPNLSCTANCYLSANIYTVSYCYICKRAIMAWLIYQSRSTLQDGWHFLTFLNLLFHNLLWIASSVRNHVEGQTASQSLSTTGLGSGRVDPAASLPEIQVFLYFFQQKESWMQSVDSHINITSASLQFQLLHLQNMPQSWYHEQVKGSIYVALALSGSLFL